MSSSPARRRPGSLSRARPCTQGLPAGIFIWRRVLYGVRWSVDEKGARMTTLRAPQRSDFSPDDQATLERVARRMGQTADVLLRPGIFGVQAHWPAWLEANFDQTLYGYRSHGVLPPLAKEAMHVAVSMTNYCSF